MRIILTLSQLQLTMDGPVSASELVHLTFPPNLRP